MTNPSGKVIIAGGSGFLGQSLAFSLQEDGYEVVILGRSLKRGLTGKFVQWNAKNELNSPVSAGLYIYTIKADGFKETKRMILLK